MLFSLTPARVRSRLPVAAAACLACSWASAQNPAPGAVAAPQTVTTVASRLPASVDRISADVVILDRQAIAALPADNLADLLQFAAGVQVSRTGGTGQPTSVLIRGAAASNTLVLVDGVRMGSASLGQFDFSTLGLAGVERIEILRGPGASVYGADAVGGVVLVHTNPSGRGAARPFVQTAVGSQGSSEAAARAGYSDRNWDMQVLASRQATRGSTAVRPGDRFGTHNPDADGYRRETLQLGGGWRPAVGHRIEASWLQADLFSRYDAAEYPPPDFNPDASPDFRTQTRTRAGQLRYEGRRGAWSWRARGGQGLEDSVSGGRTLEVYRTERREGDVQLAWSAAPGHDLVFALDQLEESVSTSAYVIPGSRRNDATTVAYTGRHGALQLQLDGREDRNSVYGTHRTGRSGLRWSLAPETSLRLLAATTFRAPSFNELYFPGFGVSTLRPEEGRSLEAGVSSRLKSASLQATLWRNAVDNLIAYSGDPARCPALPAYAFGCAANIGQARLKGLTLEAAWPTAGGATLPAWRWGYDRLDARDGEGQPLPRRARHQLRLHTHHTVGPWQLGSAWLWQSRRQEGGATLEGGTRVDLQARRALVGPWSIQLRLLNALDTDFEPARDYRAPGRQAFVGVRWEGR